MALERLGISSRIRGANLWSSAGRTELSAYKHMGYRFYVDFFAWGGLWMADAAHARRVWQTTGRYVEATSQWGRRQGHSYNAVRTWENKSSSLIYGSMDTTPPYGGMVSATLEAVDRTNLWRSLKRGSLQLHGTWH